MRLRHMMMIVLAGMALVGCEKISKPYIMTVDRVDQKVEGNKGYLQGTPPPEQTPRLGSKRSLIAVDMDLVEIKGRATKSTVIITRDNASSASQDDRIK